MQGKHALLTRLKLKMFDYHDCFSLGDFKSVIKHFNAYFMINP